VSNKGQQALQINKEWEKYHEGWFEHICRTGDAICEPAFASEYEAHLYWDEEHDQHLQEFVKDFMEGHTTIDDYMVEAPEEYSSIVYGDNTDPLPDTNDDEIERQAEYLQNLYDSQDDGL
jgi:hypothetical protein